MENKKKAILDISKELILLIEHDVVLGKVNKSTFYGYMSYGNNKLINIAIYLLNFLKRFIKTILFPIWSIFFGLKDRFKELALFFVISLFLTFFYAFYRQELESAANSIGVVLPPLHQEVMKMLEIFILIYALITVAFSIPSENNYHHFNKRRISRILNFLEDNKINDEDKLEVLQDNVLIFEEYSKNRVKALKGFMIFTFGLIVLFKKDSLLSFNFNFEMCMYFWFLLSLFLSILGYSKTIHIIFDSVKVACTEKKYQILLKEQEELI